MSAEVTVTHQRVRELEWAIQKLAGDSTRYHQSAQQAITVSSMFDENLEPQDITIEMPTNQGVETIVIPHDIWNLLTAGWEHAAEAAAYYSTANLVIDAFPEVFK